jgi:hypothetical protein
MIVGITRSVPRRARHTGAVTSPKYSQTISRYLPRADNGALHLVSENEAGSEWLREEYVQETWFASFGQEKKPGTSHKRRPPNVSAMPAIIVAAPSKLDAPRERLAAKKP